MPLRYVRRAVAAHLRINRLTEEREQAVARTSRNVKARGKRIRQRGKWVLVAVIGPYVRSKSVEADSTCVGGCGYAIQDRAVHNAEAGAEDEMRGHTVSEAGARAEVVIVGILVSPGSAVLSSED